MEKRIKKKEIEKNLSLQTYNSKQIGNGKEKKEKISHCRYTILKIEHYKIRGANVTYYPEAETYIYLAAIKMEHESKKRKTKI